MKKLTKILELIFNPFLSLITINDQTNNKGKFANLKKNPLFLLGISFVITVIIILILYRKEIFGV